MSLQKGFLRKQTVNIDGWLLFSGVLVSSVFSYLFYIAFTFIGGSLVISNFGDSGGVMLLNAQKTRFYSYSIALTSAVLGQGLGLRIILQNTGRRKPFQKRAPQQIMLNQLDLTLGFSFFLLRWAFLMTLLAVSVHAQYAFSAGEDLSYLFFLAPLTIFLNYWLHSHRLFRSKLYLWMGGAFIYLILSSVLLSAIRLVPYEHINELQLNRYKEHKYQIELSYTKAHQFNNWGRSSEQIFLIWEEGQAKVVFNYNRQEPLLLNSPEIPDILTEIKYHFPIGKAKLIITIDERVPLQNVLDFEQTLSESGHQAIVYRTIPKYSIFEWHYPPFRVTGLPKGLPISSSCNTVIDQIDSLKNKGHKIDRMEWPDHDCYKVAHVFDKNRIIVSQEKGKILLNGTGISEQLLENTLVKLMSKYQDRITIFHKPDSDDTFEGYIRVKDIIYSAVIASKSKIALGEFGTPYQHFNENNWYRDYDMRYWDFNYNQANAGYPIHVIELSGWNLEFYNYLKEQE